nr:hypothetical protein [Moritella viscosa]SHO03666.1 Bacterial transcriptional activator domain [Moritella viscosa]
MNFKPLNQMRIETLTEYMDTLIAQSKHKKLLKESRDVNFLKPEHEPHYKRDNKLNVQDYIKSH